MISFYLVRVLGEGIKIDSALMGEYASRYLQYGGLNVEKTQEELDMEFSSSLEIVEQLLEQTN